jgi:hypothetical protein
MLTKKAFLESLGPDAYATDWTPVDVFIHWEGDPMQCAHSGRMIESAYGPEETEETFTCSAWFERDRAHLSLERNGVEVFSLWDDEVSQAIEDGFLQAPKMPRPRDSDWLPCAIDYARAQGLI